MDLTDEMVHVSMNAVKYASPATTIADCSSCADRGADKYVCDVHTRRRATCAVEERVSESAAWRASWEATPNSRQDTTPSPGPYVPSSWSDRR